MPLQAGCSHSKDHSRFDGDEIRFKQNDHNMTMFSQHISHFGGIKWGPLSWEWTQSSRSLKYGSHGVPSPPRRPPRSLSLCRSVHGLRLWLRLYHSRCEYKWWTISLKSIVLSANSERLVWWYPFLQLLSSSALPCLVSAQLQGPKKWFATKEGPRQEQAIFSGSVLRQWHSGSQWISTP